MMALNAETGNASRNVKLGSDDGSERRNCETMMALNVEQGWTTTLNAERKTNNGSERQNWETMVALNAKTEKWL